MALCIIAALLVFVAVGRSLWLIQGKAPKTRRVSTRPSGPAILFTALTTVYSLASLLVLSSSLVRISNALHKGI
jgi:hypothetical protein